MDTEATYTQELTGRGLSFLVALTLAGLVYAFPLPGVSEEGRRLGSVLAIVGTLWIAEAIPLSVTALLGPSLAVVLGVAPAERAFGAFSNPIIMLFVGSFLLARATFKYRLNERIAYRVLSLGVLRDDPTRAFLFLGLTTAFISAWVSNTATTAMMLPIAQSVLLAVAPAEGRVPPTYAAGLMLVVTYSASIGGLFTPIGTPTNLIGLGLIEQATGVKVSFLDWVVQVSPIAFLTLLFMMGHLAYRFRGEHTALRYNRQQMLERYASLGPWTAVQKRVTVALLITVSLWLFPPLIGLVWTDAGTFLGARLPESVVPLLVATVLFWLPVDTRRNGQAILQVADLGEIDWTVIVLFGGGMCLGELIIHTGLAQSLGETLAAYVPSGQSPMLGLVFCLLAILVSETTSNAASANIVIPIVTAVTTQVGGDTVHLGILATVACSFGFMLPVSTPTNAMAYATGHVTQRQMIRYGVVLDIAGAIMLSAWFGIVL